MIQTSYDWFDSRVLEMTYILLLNENLEVDKIMAFIFGIVDRSHALDSLA